MSYLALAKAARERRLAGSASPGLEGTSPVAAQLTPGRSLDAIAQFQAVLGLLWILDQQGPGADLSECAVALQGHAKLVDELGPAFAEAVSRQWRRDHASQIGACQWCGGMGGEHAPDHAGAPCPLAPYDPGRPA